MFSLFEDHVGKSWRKPALYRADASLCLKIQHQHIHRVSRQIKNNIAAVQCNLPLVRHDSLIVLLVYIRHMYKLGFAGQGDQLRGCLDLQIFKLQLRYFVYIIGIHKLYIHMLRVFVTELKISLL